MKTNPVPKLANITIGNDTIDLDYLLNTEFEDVREACEKIPSAIHWLGWQRGYACERLIVSKQIWEETAAKAYFELKLGGFIEKGYGDKMTETALEKAVVLEKSVQDSVGKYAAAKRWVEIYDSAIKALSAKLDLVRTSEATRRSMFEVPPEASENTSTRHKA